MTDEQSKAAGEIAKATGEITRAARDAGGFFAKVFGPAFVQIGGIFEDGVKAFRIKNAYRLRDKVNELQEKRGLHGNAEAIPMRSAIPMIEAIVNEDDDYVQKLWAGLIVNAGDPAIRTDPKKLFIEILSSLDPLDARVMEFLSTQNWLLFRDAPGGGITLAKITTALSADEESVRLSLENLNRLGCLIGESAMTMKEANLASFGKLVHDAKATFRPSHLGYALLKACAQAPEKPAGL